MLSKHDLLYPRLVTLADRGEMLAPNHPTEAALTSMMIREGFATQSGDTLKVTPKGRAAVGIPHSRAPIPRWWLDVDWRVLTERMEPTSERVWWLDVDIGRDDASILGPFPTKREAMMNAPLKLMEYLRAAKRKPSDVFKVYVEDAPLGWRPDQSGTWEGEGRVRGGEANRQEIPLSTALRGVPKRNGRFGVGALVGAQYRRPSSNQPWHHPRYSGDPADPGHGWTGEVIAYNDPRLWANTLQFPGRTPTQEEVDAHLAHYAEVVRQSPPHVQRALREERVPVLWEYGSASLEDETGLFGVTGPVQRKRNGVQGVKNSVRMRLTRMRDEGAPLIVAMEEEGLRVNQPFSLLMLNESLSSEVMQAAVDALTGEYGNAWEDLVFADGTQVDDPGATMLTVHKITTKPGGLQGTTYSYDVTVSFPKDGRYKPNGRRRRDEATLDLFAARAQPRLLPAATQPRMATLEDLATAPLGSLLMTADRTRAYRHATAGKSGWIPQMPSASSPDGWKDRGGHAQPPGLRLFRVLTDMMAREAFYLSPPVFVAAKRNAARVLRGREIAREALRKLSSVERFRERGDWSRGEEAHVWIVSENRPVDIQIIISRRATSPDSVRFGRREWDFDRYHHVDVVGMSPDAASQKIADALAAFIRTYRTDKEIERDEEMGIEDVPLTYGVVGEMPESVRDAINAELARDVGGTVHFRSIGAAVAKCAEILARYGYEWGQVINSHTFLRDTGHTSFEIARTNTRDLFSPAQVDDVALAFQWHKFDTGNVEVVAYVSRGKANSAARRRRMVAR